jgi:hypothetical protein
MKGALFSYHIAAGPARIMPPLAGLAETTSADAGGAVTTLA